MNERSEVEMIQAWFCGASSVGLILPNGWYRRPYDDLFELTHIAGWVNRLFIELNGHLLIVINGYTRVYEGPAELTIEYGDQVFLIWRKHPSGGRNFEAFDSGSIQFVDVAKQIAIRSQG